MRVVFSLYWSDYTTDLNFPFENWELPVPRKGENVQLWCTYTGDEAGLKLHKNLAKKTLCVFMVDVVTYNHDAKVVLIKVTLLAPCLKE